jgi:hypothetical protein
VHHRVNAKPVGFEISAVPSIFNSNEFIERIAAKNQNRAGL